MARRIGANWFDSAITFDEFVSAPHVYYSVGGGEDVEILTGLSTETYQDTFEEETVTLYRGSFNGAIPAGALGSSVIKIYDPENLNDILEYDPIDVCSDAATSVVISPSTASVRPGRTRQFTANFYAADDLSTDNHDTAAWSVDDGGTIDKDTGLFTAGDISGGPFTITATSGLLNDTAVVNVTLGSNSATPLSVSLMLVI